MITDVQSVSVTYHGRKVGTLSMGNKHVCQFEYDKEWVANGFSISPLKLPLKTGIVTADCLTLEKLTSMSQLFQGKT